MNSCTSNHSRALVQKKFRRKGFDLSWEQLHFNHSKCHAFQRKKTRTTIAPKKPSTARYEDRPNFQLKKSPLVEEVKDNEEKLVKLQKALKDQVASSNKKVGEAKKLLPSKHKQKNCKVPVWRRPPQTIHVQKSQRPTRPSFQEQLESLKTAATSVTTQLRDQFLENQETSIRKKIPDANYLFTAPSTNFIVGKLRAKIPTPVRFYRDRCEYEFHHPFQSLEILMVMYFRDMSECHIQKRSRELQFKIPHRLFHYGSDYDHGNQNHFVGVTFASDLDVKRVYKLLRSNGLVGR